MPPLHNAPGQRRQESVLAIFAIFLKLGLSAFGGPAAHLGYFRNEFVLRRRWLDEADYADLVALCQFLPGPASSQVGFGLGLLRGQGLAGGCAAWLGFTLPSALILFACALGAAALSGPWAAAAIHGLKLVAVAVVAHAVWGMARSLAPDGPRAGIALAALAIVVFAGGSFGQVAAIGAGALAGMWQGRGQVVAALPRSGSPGGHKGGIVALALFFGLLLAAVLMPGAATASVTSIFGAFYRAGALVFGGGHVVLPLLRAEVVGTGWLADDRFLAGYGLAQAVPGPLFTFAAYLGASLGAGIGAGIGTAASGAIVALVAIFLPGLLLVYAALPFWRRFRTWPQAQHAVRGANAAVVGILGAALYDPVWTGAVLDGRDFAVAVAGFLLLAIWKWPPLAVVLSVAVAGALLTMLA
ncbi:chromate efflux transporter [Massilia phyllosphaerae]|uniref:chromate efflux transporter n=1 Tax=Massilia phyllosphaerae TaxID=3106034 RepID=UPI002B1CAA0A|nr:chromate efflux transporter [Massilia sp. SGZ-792]